MFTLVFIKVILVFKVIYFQVWDPFWVVCFGMGVDFVVVVVMVMGVSIRFSLVCVFGLCFYVCLSGI